jgi:hypothetical protein
VEEKKTAEYIEVDRRAKLISSWIRNGLRTVNPSGAIVIVIRLFSGGTVLQVLQIIIHSEEKLTTLCQVTSIDIVQLKSKYACSQVLIYLTQKCFFVSYFNASDQQTLIYSLLLLLWGTRKCLFTSSVAIINAYSQHILHIQFTNDCLQIFPLHPSLLSYVQGTDTVHKLVCYI